MVVSIEEAKQYLKVEFDEDDKLIKDFITAAEEIIEGILRFPLTEFEEVPETVQQAVLFIVSNMYEQRDKVKIKEIIDTVKNLLFMHRKDSW